MKRDETVVEMVNGCLTAQHISQLSMVVGKSATVIEQALEPLIPLIVRTLADRVARPQGVEAIWAVTRQAQGTQISTHLTALNIASWRRRGVLLLQGLLSDAYDTTTYRMATKAGLSLSSYALVIEVAVAAVLGVLSNYVTEHRLDATGLSSWLQSQPRLTAAATAAAAATVAAQQPDASATAINEAPTQRPAIPANSNIPPKFVAGGGTWESVGGGSIFIPKRQIMPGLRLDQLQRWKWALLLLPVLAIGYGIFNWDRSSSSLTLSGQNGSVVAATAPAADPNVAGSDELPFGAGLPPGRYDPATDTYIYYTGQPLIITLPNGSTQKVGMNSTEYQLYRFLADSARQVDSPNPAKGWINVDRVYFTSGQAILTAESQQQLRNLAGILKTFPRAQVMFGGYSDGVGDNLKNQLLSGARARMAMRALAGEGISSRRLRAIGYGEAYPVASNAAPVGRALNRRLSLKVITKSGPIVPEPEALKPASALVAASSRAAVNSTRPKTTAQLQQRKKKAPRSKVGRWIKNLGQNLRGKRARKE